MVAGDGPVSCRAVVGLGRGLFWCGPSGGAAAALHVSRFTSHGVLALALLLFRPAEARASPATMPTTLSRFGSLSAGGELPAVGPVRPASSAVGTGPAWPRVGRTVLLGDGGPAVGSVAGSVAARSVTYSGAVLVADVCRVLCGLGALRQPGSDDTGLPSSIDDESPVSVCACAVNSPAVGHLGA